MAGGSQHESPEDDDCNDERDNDQKKEKIQSHTTTLLSFYLKGCGANTAPYDDIT
jgi:hypothetical protein